MGRYSLLREGQVPLFLDSGVGSLSQQVAGCRVCHLLFLLTSIFLRSSYFFGGFRFSDVRNAYCEDILFCDILSFEIV